MATPAAAFSTPSRSLRTFLSVGVAFVFCFGCCCCCCCCCCSRLRTGRKSSMFPVRSFHFSLWKRRRRFLAGRQFKVVAFLFARPARCEERSAGMRSSRNFFFGTVTHTHTHTHTHAKEKKTDKKMAPRSRWLASKWLIESTLG